MYLSLMGTFNFLASILVVDSTSDGLPSPLSPISFLTMYLSDPSNLPSLGNSDEGPTPTGTGMLLFAVWTAYQSLFDIIVDPNRSLLRTKKQDLLLSSTWVAASSCSHGFLDGTFPSNEAII